MRRITLTRQDVHKGNLVLVNSYHLIQNKEFFSNLESFNEEYKEILLDQTANRCLQDALNEIGAKNSIVPVSGYRSLEEQEEIFRTSLIQDGEEFTLKYVALPNASEHQTGLAIDLGLNLEEIDFIRPSFPRTGICEAFRKVAAKYGFVERYKEEKESITHISAEEWHFRYVGYPHAEVMDKKGLCLEEYIEFLKAYQSVPFKYGRYEITFLPYVGEELEVELDAYTQVSGNNVDGFILTRVVK